MSATALPRSAHPEARFDAVRLAGVGVYGLSPFGGDPADDGLRPALRFEELRRAGEAAGGRPRARATAAGSSPSGRSGSASAPAGYADGVPACCPGGRMFSSAACDGGSPATVSMDQLTFVIGPECPGRRAGRPRVVLIGSDGGESIRVEEWAELSETINYEIVTDTRAPPEGSWSTSFATLEEIRARRRPRCPGSWLAVRNARPGPVFRPAWSPHRRPGGADGGGDQAAPPGGARGLPPRSWWSGAHGAWVLVCRQWTYGRHRRLAGEHHRRPGASRLHRQRDRHPAGRRGTVGSV